MHFKKDVLSQFRKVRSYERIDLLCSLLDLCLPFELRFLGTCLEFLGKRDFNELREDERQANNVNHISQFRSLTDENTRRKLVLYVSLLKSCNSDCANCFNDTLASLNMNEVCLSYRAEPDTAAKALDELLLLYTIALNHPAFTIHQKSEFATILAHLQEEDRKISLVLSSSKDSQVRCSEYCLLPDSLQDPSLQLKLSPHCSLEDSDGSSQLSVNPLVSPLTCHAPPGSAYVVDILSPTLSQVSTASLGPPLVIVSSVSGHSTTTTPVQVEASTGPQDMVSVMGSDTNQSPSPVTLPVATPVVPSVVSPVPPPVPPTVAPSTSSLVLGHSMMVPLGIPPGSTSTSSHCIMPTPVLPTGDLGITKGPLMLPMLGMPPAPDSMIHMSFPGPTPWGMMLPMQGHIPVPTSDPSTTPTSTSPSPSTQPSVPAYTPTSESEPSSATSSAVTSVSSSTSTSMSTSVSTPISSATPSTAPTVSSCVSSNSSSSSANSSPCTPSPVQLNGPILLENIIVPVAASEGPPAHGRQSSPSSSRGTSPPRKNHSHTKGNHHQNHTHVQHHTGQHLSHSQPSQLVHHSQVHQQVLTNLPSQSNHQGHPSHHPPVQQSPRHQSPTPQTPVAPPAPQAQTHSWQQNCVDASWHSGANAPGDPLLVGDHLKEAIGRELPKYQANLQDYSPDELFHMTDEQLKELGLSLSAIQQLRSIVQKVQVPNGFNCISRREPHALPNEGTDQRMRYQSMDGQVVMTMPPMMTTATPCAPTYNYIPMMPSGNGNTNNSNGSCGMYGKAPNNNRQHHHLHLMHQMRSLRLEEDGRRPCSNSSSTSDCSSGSHSPPETPSLPSVAALPHSHHWDRGTWPSSNMHNRRIYDHHTRRGSDQYHSFTQSAHSLHGYTGKETTSESWNSVACDDRNREDRLHEQDRSNDERLRGHNYQAPGMQRNAMNRPRGVSKATPPGIPSIPRGRGHHLMDKSRRDMGGGPMNGVPPPPPEVTTPSPFTMSAGTTVPYTTPVTSFLPPTAFPAMHTFHRFQPSYIHPASTAYPFHPNGDMWSQYPQPPHQNPPFMAPIVAFSPAHPPPKLSCYNCGGQGHHGGDCKESTFEEITQQGQYHLDYKPFKEAGDCRESDK